MEVENSIPCETCFIIETEATQGCIWEDVLLQIYVHKNFSFYFKSLSMLPISGGGK
jgi:hypothetical protein